VPHILIVEDDSHLANGLRYNLEREGYDVEVAQDGERAWMRLQTDTPDLVLLDLMLPGLDGYAVLERMREQRTRPPVIILSARDAEVDKIRGFDGGADDYVTKPFSLGELLARIRKRLRDAAARRTFRLGARRIDLDRHEVSDGTTRWSLTPTEVALLEILWSRRSTPIDREELMQRIWGVERTTSRTLDAHVTRLRKKIEDDPASPRHLVTVHGVGYRLD